MRWTRSRPRSATSGAAAPERRSPRRLPAAPPGGGADDCRQRRPGGGADDCLRRRTWEARMIASVAGRVSAVAPEAAVIEVGGVGFAVQCTPNTRAGRRVGQPARLATSLIVREDSLTLYGF